MHADFAVLSIGGVTVPIYPTYTPEQVAYIVNDSGARTLIVEDASQLAKTLEVRARMPALEHIVVIEGDDTHEPPVVSWESMRRAGQRHATTLQAVLAERVTRHPAWIAGSGLQSYARIRRVALTRENSARRGAN